MRLILAAILLLITSSLQAQTITGTIPQHAGQQISLTGFNYYNSYKLASTTVDSLGYFSLNYPKDYKGMGIINTQDNSSLIVVLTSPTISFRGTHLTQTDSLKFKASAQNTKLASFAKNNLLRQQAYQAWRYLLPIYSKQNNQPKVLKTIAKETARIAKADSVEINQIPNKYSYLRWFLTMRTLVNNMPATVHNYPERLSQNIQQFRAINLANPNFKTSGLYKELIEGHYMLLENMGQPLDSVAVQMNLSTKHLIDNLQSNDDLLNETAKNLFNYFEKRSLFTASEYLSVSLLSNKQCSLHDDLVAKLESYRKLKVGATAPDITLNNKQKLSEVKTNKLVVFGASWCPNCKTEALELLKFFDAWKTKNVEIVYISIDTDTTAFETAYKNAPWQTYSDFKGWDTQAAKDYYITGTPSYFLLDVNNKILVRPNSVAHANAWIEHKLD